jgi:cell division protease FtsH
LVEHRDKLDLMAEALMKYETIDRLQIDDIMEGRDARAPKGWDDRGGSSGGAATSVDKEDASTEGKAKSRASDDSQGGVGRPAGEH